MLLNLEANELKKIIKKLSLIKHDTLFLDIKDGFAYAADNEMSLFLYNDLLKTEDEDNIPAAVNSKLFSSVVSSLKGNVELFRESLYKPIRVKTEKLLAEVSTSAETLNAKLPLLDSKTAVFSFPKKKLSQLFSFATSVSDTDTPFDFASLVILDVKKNVLKAVGTDHARLAFTEINDKDCSYNLEMQLPVRLAKAIKELDADKVLLSQNDTSIAVSAGDITIIARKLAKPFPAYENIIPKEINIQLSFDAKEMLEALKQVAPLLDSADKNKRTELFFDGTTITLKTKSFLNGQASIWLEAEQIYPDPFLFEEIKNFTCAINHSFLTDYFEQANGKVILHSQNKPGAPVFFQNNGLNLVVSPLNTPLPVKANV